MLDVRINGWDQWVISPQYIPCIGRWTNPFTNHLLTSWDIQVYVDCLVSSHRVWHTDQVYIPYTNAIPTVSFIEHFKKKIHHIPFMVYLSTWIVDFHGKCVTADIPVPMGFPYGYLFRTHRKLVGFTSFSDGTEANERKWKLLLGDAAEAKYDAFFNAGDSWESAEGDRMLVYQFFHKGVGYT